MLAIGRASVLRGLGRLPFPSGLYNLDVFDERLSIRCVAGPQTTYGQRIPTARCTCALFRCSLMLFAPVTQASAAAVDLAAGGFQRHAAPLLRHRNRPSSSPYGARDRPVWVSTHGQPLAALVPDSRLAAPARLRTGCSSSVAARARGARHFALILLGHPAPAHRICARGFHAREVRGAWLPSSSAPRCCTARRSQSRLRCAAVSARSGAPLTFEPTHGRGAVSCRAGPSRAAEQRRRSGVARHGGWPRGVCHRCAG